MEYNLKIFIYNYSKIIIYNNKKMKKNGEDKMSEISPLIYQCKKHLQKYEYKESRLCCEKILEKFPESWFGLKYKGVSLYQTGKYDEAKPVYEKHNQLYPDDKDTITTLIIMYEEKQEYTKALPLYKKINNTDEVKSKEKRLLYKIKEYQQIINQYEHELNVLEDYDESVEIIKRKMILLEEKGIYEYKNKDYEKAYDSYKKTLQLYPKIEHTILKTKRRVNKWYAKLEELIQEYEDSSDFLKELFNLSHNTEMWYCRIKYNISQFEDPLVYPTILLETDPENITILNVSAWRTYNYDRNFSVNCWKKILEIEPENTEAIQNILDIYSQEYSKDRALRLINSKLYITEIKPKLLMQKIRILESMTLYDEAIKTYDEYLSLNITNELNPKLTQFDKIRCMEEKALRLYIENKLQESFDTYNEVYETFNKIEKTSDVNDEEWKIEDWYTLILGISLKEAGYDYRRFFNKFYTLNYETLKLWNNKIEFLINWRYFGNPITYCNLLLEKNEDNFKIKMLKAGIYHKTKRLSKSVELYEEILKQYPENKEINYIIFKILIQMGEYEDAYKILRTINDTPKEIEKEVNTLKEYLFEEKNY